MGTIHTLIDEVHGVVTAEGMDLSPNDVGRIVGLFLGKLARGEGPTAADDILKRIAHDCLTVRNE